MHEEGFSKNKISLIGETSYDWIVSYFSIILSDNIVVPIDKELSDNEILKDFDIKLDEIILLEEAGLINTNPLTISGTNIYQYKNYLINFLDDKPTLQIYFLTKSGCELESIVNNEINIDYLSKIKQKYKIQKMNYSIILSRTENENEIKYSLSNTKYID